MSGKPLLSILLLTVMSHNVQAGSAADVLVALASESQLWKNRIWLNLGHYEGSGDEPTNYQSQADDQRFFLAEDGKTNPSSELVKTLEAFYRTDDRSNEHALCRFPARLKWLSDSLPIDSRTLPEVSCSDYAEWRGMIKADRVTMVFPAYHLNSPSSMYGHTLLRIDPASDADWSDWLSYAVNFGADIAVDDNSIFYAFKGLSGGYPGIFITEPYFKKIQEYNKIEHRDIWEYRLNLTQAETEMMVLHLWELKTINFDYYFFDENCSYRLLELLEVARPGLELTREFVVTAIPVDTVRAIDDAGLIESIEYRPSRATILQHQIEQIPVQYHDLVEQLAGDSALLNSTRLTSLDAALQRRIVDAAYQYLRYTQTREARDPAIAARSFALLKAINTYPANSDDMIEPLATPVPPERGHGSKRVVMGASSRDGTGYANLGFRMSFHDLEDNEQGFLRGAQINIGSIDFRASKAQHLQLDRLDLVDIFSITPRNQFFKPLSWSVNTGLERQFTNGVDQLVLHVTGGVGVTYELLENSSYYLMARARLEYNKQLDRKLEPAIGGMFGILQHFGRSTAHLKVTGDQFNRGVYRLRTSYTHNFVLAQNHALNIELAYEWQDLAEYAEYLANYQYYFW